MRYKLMIVSGATGDLGKKYLYKHNRHDKFIGLARKKDPKPIPGVQYLNADLTEPIMTAEQINKISLEDVESVHLIHTVGKFKFEVNGVPEFDNDGIDDEVKTSNFDTFYNIVQPLLKLTKGSNCTLNLVAFGSLSDKYMVPWWQSYSKSKLMLKEYIQNLTRTEPKVNGVFFNLSSVNTSKEAQLRPFADKSFWLEPYEIVDKSHHFIYAPKFFWEGRDFDIPPSNMFFEMDIFKPWPGYHKDYYKDFDALKHEWLKAMGKE